jgi:sec-independent protein translocase protein TatB
MFEIGWTEMLVIAVIMIVIVGPKDLPKMLRAFGKTTTKLRSMAGDFQRQFNDALKEAELDDVKESVDALRGLNPANEIKKQLNPFEKAASDVRAGLDTLKPKPPEPASPVARPAEPLKNGAADMPGDGPAAGAPDAPAATPATQAVAASAAAPVAAAKVAKPRAPRKKADEAAPAKPKAAPRKKKTESSAP